MYIIWMSFVNKRNSSIISVFGFNKCTFFNCFSRYRLFAHSVCTYATYRVFTRVEHKNKDQNAYFFVIQSKLINMMNTCVYHHITWTTNMCWWFDNVNYNYNNIQKHMRLRVVNVNVVVSTTGENTCFFCMLYFQITNIYILLFMQCDGTHGYYL